MRFQASFEAVINLTFTPIQVLPDPLQERTVPPGDGVFVARNLVSRPLIRRVEKLRYGRRGRNGAVGRQRRERHVFVVPDTGNHRRGKADDLADKEFVIETGERLERSAAAHDYDRIERAPAQGA